MPDSPRSTIAIWVVAAVVAALAAMRFLGGGEPAPPPVSVDGAADPASAAAGKRASGSSSAEALFVHVAGAVRRPGLLRVSAGARVAVALERAGGPTRHADLTLVNLAARLQDGQQIVVPVRGAIAGGSATAGGSSSGGAAQPQIHLAMATSEQLDEIDGIGPTLAERIVEYRDEHGGFKSLDELSQVDGIGEKRLASLRNHLQP